jgi:hypothetical protein
VQHHALRRIGFINFLSANFDAFYNAFQPGGQNGDPVVFAIYAADDLAGISSVVMQFRGLRPDNVLNREPSVGMIDVFFQLNVFQVMQQ